MARELIEFGAEQQHSRMSICPKQLSFASRCLSLTDIQILPSPHPQVNTIWKFWRRLRPILWPVVFVRSIGLKLWPPSFSRRWNYNRVDPICVTSPTPSRRHRHILDISTKWLSIHTLLYQKWKNFKQSNRGYKRQPSPPAPQIYIHLQNWAKLKSSWSLFAQTALTLG